MCEMDTTDIFQALLKPEISLEAMACACCTTVFMFICDHVTF